MGMEHYIKVKDLGGTNGAFLARDRQRLDRLVVIKQLAAGTQGLEELNASLRLRHSHIIRFLESFIYEGNLFVVMHYEPGGDLEELFRYLLHRHKTPTTHTLLLWFVQLLEALAYCHANHVIHRDIKPGNILVSEDTKLLYLGDFGSAKTLVTSNVTSTFVGSPLWISPEVLMGMQYSYAADIWSLGCVFYEMATLRKPFGAPSFAHLVQKITRGQVAPLPPQVAPEVRVLIDAMLRLEPAARTTAAAALETARVALHAAEAQRLQSPPGVRAAASQAPPSLTSSPLRPPPVTSPPPAAPALSSSTSSCPAVGATPTDTAAPLETELAVATPSASPAPTPPPPPMPALPPYSTAEADEAAAPSTPPPMESSVTKKEVRSRGTGTPPSASTCSGKSSPLPNEEAAVAEPCTPQQLVLNFPTDGFRKPPARLEKVVLARRGVAKRPQISSAQPKPKPNPVRRKVAAVPAPPDAPPNFIRQCTADVLAVRRASHTSAAEVLNGRRSRSNDGAAMEVVVVKAAPPAALTKRAKAAAESPAGRPRNRGESPPRLAAAAPGSPAAPPMVPGAAKVAADGQPWLDERLQELSAMAAYLHQHRVDDDKVLQTYDARRRAEQQQLEAPPPQHPSPAPRRHSPSVELAPSSRRNAAAAALPPSSSVRRRRQPPPPPSRSSAAAAVASASPSLARQASYARQSSDARQSSLASTFNGRQASNARLRPAVTAAEQGRLEAERAAAREKREAERRRMKELIQEHRTVAKKQHRRPKKGSAGEACGVAVDIVLPNHKHYIDNDAATA